MWDLCSALQTATLENGLTIHTAHWEGKTWEKIWFIVHSGASQDPVGLEGTAHFVEHLLSVNNPEERVIQDMIEGWGGYADMGGINYHSARYGFGIPSDEEKLRRVLLSFGTMLLSSTLEHFIERERQVILSEFNHAFESSIDYEMRVDRNKNLYEGYWMERFASPLGSLESVRLITKKDLQAFYDQHYTPANISVIAIGGMDRDTLVRLFSESPFGKQKDGLRTPIPSPIFDFTPLNYINVEFKVKQDNSNQTFLKGFYRSAAKFPRIVDREALLIFVSMLYSTLIEEIRAKRGWLYKVQVELSYTFLSHQIVFTLPGLALESLSTVGEVVEQAIDSIGSNEGLFIQKKSSLVSSYAMLDEDGFAIGNRAIHGLSDYHRIITLEEQIQCAERVTMDDIREILRWFHKEMRYTAVINPR